MATMNVGIKYARGGFTSINSTGAKPLLFTLAANEYAIVTVSSRYNNTADLTLDTMLPSPSTTICSVSISANSPASTMHIGHTGNVYAQITATTTVSFSWTIFTNTI